MFGAVKYTQDQWNQKIAKAMQAVANARKSILEGEADIKWLNRIINNLPPRIRDSNIGTAAESRDKIARLEAQLPVRKHNLEQALLNVEQIKILASQDR